MKILHTADVHLGVKNGRLSKDKQNLLKDEAVYNIRYFFEMAKEKEYDIILICGDLFHSKTIPSKFSKAFFDAVKDFDNPVLYISGNHDENFVLPTNLPTNFVVLDNNNTVFSYGDFNFYSQYNDFSNVNKKFNNILLVHGNIENTRDADYVDINKFLNKGFDYIALGHIHQSKKYKSENDTFAYSGSLFSNGFDEAGERGFINLEIEDKIISSFEFCPFATRKFVVCESNISNMVSNREIIEKINEDLSKLSANQNDLVRVILKGAVDEDCEKSLAFIVNKFDHYFHFEINDETTLKIDLDKIKNEKLSFKYEFISLVENSNLDEAIKRAVCEIGLEALKGEDINI